MTKLRSFAAVFSAVKFSPHFPPNHDEKRHNPSTTKTPLTNHQNQSQTGTNIFYFIMQTATYELYYLPKGAGERSYTRGINHTLC